MEPCSSNSNSEAVYSHLPCFFCNGLTDNSQSSNVNIQSLGNLFNYLQLCPPNVTGNNNHVEMEMSSILSICKRCSQMAEEFNELHHVLEVTKKLLNRCLGRVLEVMAKAEHDTQTSNNEEDADGDDGDGDLRTAMIGRIKEVSKGRSRPAQMVATSVVLDDHSGSAIRDSNRQSRTTNANATNGLPSTHLDTEDFESNGNKSDGDTGRGSEQVRNFTTRGKRHKKTRRRLFSITDSNYIPASSSYPSTSSKMNENKSFANIYHSLGRHSDTDDKVKIPRKKRSKLKKRNINAGKVCRNICKFCNKTFTHSCNAQRHMKYTCPKNEERLPPPDTGLLLTCAYCSFKCPNHHSNMKPHLIRSHPEMFFQSELNNSSVTSAWKQENFKSIVKDIALAKFISRNEKAPSNCSCSVCGKQYCKEKFFSKNRYDLMIHLVKNHFQQVKDSVKDIMEQSDASLKEQLDTASKNATSRRRSRKLELESDVCDVEEDENDVPASLLYGFSMWDTLMDADADVDESCSVLPDPTVIVPSSMD